MTSTILRRRAFAAIVAILALTVSSCSNATAEYPAKKMEILVGYGAGSANDTIARALGASLEEVSGANVLIVNQPGASGIVSTTQAMLAPADGYNLVLAPISAFTTAPLLQEVHYGPEDFRTVAAVAEQPLAVVVRADSPFNSLTDLASAPEQLTAASLGTGHAGEIVIREIMSELGKDVRPIPFDGAGNAIQSTIAGETDLSVVDLNTAVSRINSGEAKALAITGENKVDVLPDTSTVVEEGFPDASYMAAQALAVPAQTPPEIIERLEELTDEAMSTESYTAFLENTNIRRPDMLPTEWMDTYAPREKERLAEAYQKFGVGR